MARASFDGGAAPLRARSSTGARARSQPGRYSNLRGRKGGGSGRIGGGSARGERSGPWSDRFSAQSRGRKRCGSIAYTKHWIPLGRECSWPRCLERGSRRPRGGRRVSKRRRWGSFGRCYSLRRGHAEKRRQVRPRAQLVAGRQHANRSTLCLWLGAENQPVDEISSLPAVSSKPPAGRRPAASGDSPSAESRPTARRRVP